VVVHAPEVSGILSLDFFNFVSQIGTVLDARWTSGCASVTYSSKEDTYRCFEGLTKKGYLAAISVVSAPYVRELR